MVNLQHHLSKYNSFPENGKSYFFMLLCKCIYIYGKFLSKKWQLLIVQVFCTKGLLFRREK